MFLKTRENDIIVNAKYVDAVWFDSTNKCVMIDSFARSYIFMRCKDSAAPSIIINIVRKINSSLMKDQGLKALNEKFLFNKENTKAVKIKSIESIIPHANSNSGVNIRLRNGKEIDFDDTPNEFQRMSSRIPILYPFAFSSSANSEDYESQ